MARLLLKILNANPYFGMQLTEQGTKDRNTDFTSWNIGSKLPCKYSSTDMTLPQIS